VYGHEGAGIVSEVGRDVVGLVAGDHVVVTLIRSCGQCHTCRSGRPVICETRTALDERSPLTDADGVSVVHGMRTGAFGDHVVVDASQLVKIPDDIAFDVAALLGCGVITGFGAVTNTAQVAAGSNVVVIGCGGVGLNSLQGANVSEAATVIAVDVAESKLAIAPRFGATHTINSGEVDAVDAVREVTAGRGADYVFVTVGAKSAYDQSYAMLARGGAVVVVGLPYAGVLSEIDPGAMADHSHRILGSKMGSARITVDIPYLIGLYRQGRLKLDELISGRYPLDRINDAIASVKSGEALRNVIVFA
jgi:Zn-dependent alcohol dehydrogenase